MTDPEFVPTHIVRFGDVSVSVHVDPGVENPVTAAAATAVEKFTSVDPEVIDLSEPTVSQIVRREDIEEWWA